MTQLCPALKKIQQQQRDSPEYMAFLQSNYQLIQELNVVLPNFTTFKSGGDPLDCIYTTACSGMSVEPPCSYEH